MSSRSKCYKGGAAELRRVYIEQARPIAEQYQLVIWTEDGEYYGRGVELPYAFGEGKTIELCVKNTRQAFVTAIAGYLQDGNLPPMPALRGA